ncbi:hypothetical protein [Leucobacter ruminantium]|uniref:DUF7882 domain-containing protein n=1 Tax=Leucobacter ruminantium TaxID=1289170 RepID=A0A939RVU5_9MICO|nr:hypothetical protein [Leucobacter ruminantium]MBO1804322.1 hypothetical protein [Leucobacter ruminantium]
MGYLHYGYGKSFAFDDRTLTHLRTTIFGKLNLQESVVFTWVDEDGHQRSIWLQPGIPLHFEFDAAETPDINPAWIEQLMAHANAPSGLRLVDEPGSEKA